MIRPFALSEFLNLSDGFFWGDRSLWKEPVSVCIDSRKVTSRSLFVPLEGERTDGHRHIEEAIFRGASVFLVSRSWARGHSRMIKKWAELCNALFFPVDDTLKGLQTLAARYRSRFSSLNVVGVTGSNGKTTTKEMLASVLAQDGRTYKNPGNLNSEIGLPLSILGMSREQDHAVLEMGINHVGEMDVMVHVAKPSMAVITNIGTAHIGFMGSMRRIAEEKRKIFASMDSSGRAFIHEDEPFWEFLAEPVRGRVIPFGLRHLPDFKGVRNRGLAGQDILLADCSIHLPLPGEHNLNNALAAVAVARELGLSLEQIKAGLESIVPVFGRTQIFEGTVKVVQDCYNANPDSVLAALQMFGALPCDKRRFAVLGDMLELGAESENLHKSLGSPLAFLALDKVFFLGHEMEAAAREYETSGRAFQHFLDFEELKNSVLSFSRPGDLVLLKGSRGMALERLTEALLALEG